MQEQRKELKKETQRRILTLRQPLSLERQSNIYLKTKNQHQLSHMKPCQEKTESDQKDQKQEESKQSYEKFKQALEWLLSTFPKCFNYKNPRPLKRLIERDIYPHLPKDGSLSKISIRSAIIYYVNNVAYLSSILGSQNRIDLYGNFVMEVTNDEKEHTQQKLNSLKVRRIKKTKKFIKDINFSIGKNLIT